MNDPDLNHSNLSHIRSSLLFHLSSLKKSVLIALDDHTLESHSNLRRIADQLSELSTKVGIEIILGEKVERALYEVLEIIWRSEEVLEVITSGTCGRKFLGCEGDAEETEEWFSLEDCGWQEIMG